MIELLQNLISTLREELQQYGEMLARLDDQQELVVRRAAGAVLESVSAVQAQSTVLGLAREGRFNAVKQLATHLGLPEDAPFRKVIPLLPSDYRPLVQALVQENNELLQRIHQRVRQNHLLLSRTVDSMQHVIDSLLRHRPAAVYNEQGTLFSPPPEASRIYEAVC